MEDSPCSFKLRTRFPQVYIFCFISYFLYYFLLLPLLCQVFLRLYISSHLKNLDINDNSFMEILRKLYNFRSCANRLEQSPDHNSSLSPSLVSVFLSLCLSLCQCVFVYKSICHFIVLQIYFVFLLI